MTTIIIANDRDRAGLDYLTKRVGAAAIDAALAALPGERKPYVTNVAKQLNIEIPKDLQPAVNPTSAARAAALAAIRAMPEIRAMHK